MGLRKAATYFSQARDLQAFHQRATEEQAELLTLQRQLEKKYWPACLVAEIHVDDGIS